MKPKLKNDTLYIPVEGGIYFVSNRGTLTLEGRHVYQWVSRLAPHLNGTHTLTEITGSLPADKRDMVVNLVGALHDKGFIKDVTEDLPHHLDAAEEQLYASEIAFVDYYRDSAAYRFARFRESGVLAVGSGLTLTALVHAVLHAGVRDVEVLTTGEGPTDTARHAEYAKRARERDPKQSLVHLSAEARTASPERLRDAVRRSDVVVHVSDRPMIARARMLGRLCAEQEKVLVQAVLVGDHAWIGPLAGPGVTGSCWECGWLRYLGHQGEGGVEDEFTDRAGSVVSPFLAGPTAALVSNMLSFEVFKHVTGVGLLETEATMVDLDLETLQSERHAVRAHPLCGSHGAVAAQSESVFLDGVRQLSQGAEIGEEAFSTGAAELFDAKTGLLGRLEERDFDQTILRVSQATVASPLLMPGRTLTAIGVGPDFSTARQHATRRACELYAAGTVDTRRLLPDGGGDAPGSVWGYDPDADVARTVCATCVFPVLHGELPSERTAPGLASGFTWAEAVTRGLLAQCNLLTFAELDHASPPRATPEPGAIALTERAARYLRVFDLTGDRVEVHDVTGSLDIPTFVACVGDRAVACVCDVDVPHALEALLERAVQDHQARFTGQPDCAPRELPAAPPELRTAPLDLGTASPTTSQHDGQHTWREKQQLVQRRLREGGWRPVVVPLDHDPVLNAALPYIVNVVLERG